MTAKNPEAKPVALVTGGARRIGAAIARALAEDGYAVAIHCLTSVSDAERLAEDVARNGGIATSLRGDLAKAEDLDAILDEANRTLGPVQALVNNASLFTFDEAADFDLEVYDKVMAVNLRAPLYLASKMAAALGEEEQGSVINILDQKVYNLNPDFFSYTVGRLALERATKLQAMALAPKVRINGIAPGLTLPEASQPQDHFEALHAAMPLGRGSQVTDIIDAVRFLLTAHAVSGEIITVDGGQHFRAVARDTLFQSP